MITDTDALKRNDALAPRSKRCPPRGRGHYHGSVKQAYVSLKHQVVNWTAAPGARLHIEQLAEQLRVSTTPVREILNRLAAEELIVMIPKMGFFMKSLSESEFRDLYELNCVLLNWSLGGIRLNPNSGDENGFSKNGSARDSSVADGSAANQPNGIEKGFQILQLAQRITQEELASAGAELFADIADCSNNAEVSVRVRNINDRLHILRLHESQALVSTQTELEKLYRYYHAADFDRLGSAIVDYHDSRLAALPHLMEIVKYGYEIAQDCG